LAVFLALACFALAASLMIRAVLSTLGRSTLGKRHPLLPAIIPVEVASSADRRAARSRRASLKRALRRSQSAE